MSRKVFVHLSVKLTVCILVILLTPVLTNADAVNWQFVGLRGKDVEVLYVHPKTPTTLYAVIRNSGIRKSIYRSIDGGLSWKIVEKRCQCVCPFAWSPGYSLHIKDCAAQLARFLRVSRFLRAGTMGKIGNRFIKSNFQTSVGIL